MPTKDGGAGFGNITFVTNRDAHLQKRHNTSLGIKEHTPEQSLNLLIRSIGQMQGNQKYKVYQSMMTQYKEKLNQIKTKEEIKLIKLRHRQSIFNPCETVKPDTFYAMGDQHQNLLIFDLHNLTHNNLMPKKDMKKATIPQ